MERDDVLVPLVKAAEQLAITPTSLRRHIHAGHIQALRPSRDWVLWQSEIDRFQRERRPRQGGRPRKPASPPAAE